MHSLNNCAVKWVVGNVWSVHKKNTMAPHLHLGIGASCTVKLRFLHLKDKVNEKVPNQSASQSISGLIVQSKAEKSIWKAAKSCVIFHHEDFGGQLIWALPRYVTVDVQGPEEAFFVEEPQQPTTRAAGRLSSSPIRDCSRQHKSTK